jgi:hypothetical protein
VHARPSNSVQGWPRGGGRQQLQRSATRLEISWKEFVAQSVEMPGSPREGVHACEDRQSALRGRCVAERL